MVKNWYPFTQDFGTVNAGTTQSFPLVVPGAVEFGWPTIGWQLGADGAHMSLGIIVQSIVSAPDEVTIYLTNVTAGNITVGPLDFVVVITIEE